MPVAGQERRPPDDLVERYLDLCKRSLMGGHYRAPTPWDGTVRAALYGPMRSGLSHIGYELVHAVDPAAKEQGLDHASDALTMVGRQRLDNIQFCVTDVLRNRVPGDLIETGVWRGGSAIFMRAILYAHGDCERTVWVADSFQGLPKPDPRYPADKGDRLWTARGLAVAQDEVEANFASFGLLDRHVRFLNGWFKDTLPTAPIDRLAVLRLDGDLYESTTDALQALYDKVSVGGYVIIDDYANERLPGCRRAVDEFRSERGLTGELRQVDWTAVFWRRES
jgi:O-methyltransferase